MKEFKEKDKDRSFDLSEDVLMRVSVLRFHKTGYDFTWSFHHILMDGWGIGILNTEFFEIYTGYLEGRSYRLPPVKPFRTYIQWLQTQDKDAPARYWQSYLDSFREPTGLPKAAQIQDGYSSETLSFSLDRKKSTRLNQLAAARHVTMNMLTQSLWGILLGKYTGKTDVVFGAVVSGRPAQLEGVETIAGLFINTIPVRVRFEGEMETGMKMKFHRLLEQIREEAMAGEPYHYYPLAEIQVRSKLKHNLMDHVFTFENYPITERIRETGHNGNQTGKPPLKITDANVFEQSNYDLNVVLSSSDQMNVTFLYNGNVYERDAMERIVRHFNLIVDQVLENEEIAVEAIDILSEEEKSRILNDFQSTYAEYPKEKTGFNAHGEPNTAEEDEEYSGDFGF
ncbi:MAG: hypothetical protein GY940_34895 [bacterium]|nr:hypothetical protein [bacterium]